jgi:isocitrate/isopropylmalate dehydrogenase
MSSVQTFKIAAIPGDGIGTEITAAAIQVLDKLAEWKLQIRLYTL